MPGFLLSCLCFYNFIAWCLSSEVIFRFPNGKTKLFILARMWNGKFSRENLNYVLSSGVNVLSVSIRLWISVAMTKWLCFSCSLCWKVDSYSAGQESPHLYVTLTPVIVLSSTLDSVLTHLVVLSSRMWPAGRALQSRVVVQVRIKLLTNINLKWRAPVEWRDLDRSWDARYSVFQGRSAFARQRKTTQHLFLAVVTVTDFQCPFRLWRQLCGSVDLHYKRAGSKWVSWRRRKRRQ
jgi:hypothetical protein